MNDSSIQASGYCQKCDCEHSIEVGKSRIFAEQLFKNLEEFGRIDFDSNESDPLYSTDYLWGEARGQMFGVLHCIDNDGKDVILKAFSCQYNSQWKITGWVPPLLDVELYHKIVPPVDAEIKRLTAEIEKKPNNAKELKLERKTLSQKFMKEIHSLYSLMNFNGEESTLADAFSLSKGMPTGTGDCCAPKLLNFAARNNLKPLGLSEFYFGKENKSRTRRHGDYYTACENKCQPILGFLLCGIDDV